MADSNDLRPIAPPSPRVAPAARRPGRGTLTFVAAGAALVASAWFATTSLAAPAPPDEMAVGKGGSGGGGGTGGCSSP